MEGNNSTSEQGNAELQKSVKSGMGLVVFAVIMTVVALAACGILIYTKATEDKRISDAVNSKCLTPADSSQAPVEGNTNPSSDTPEIADNTTPSDNATPSDATVNTGDYLYVGEWGYKIKLPSTHYVKYRYEPNTGSEHKGTLYLSAQDKNAQQWPNYGNFDNGGSVIQVFRLDHENTEPASAPKLIGIFDGYYYYEARSQQCAVFDDCENENAILNVLETTFLDANNYSKI